MLIVLAIGLLGSPFGSATLAATGGTPMVVTFNPNGGVQNFSVPPGVTSLTIEAVGAAGGTACGNRAGAGKGSSAKGTFTVTAGSTLAIVVGGEGGAGATNRCGGGGGGGASLVWECSTTCSASEAFSRLLIIGGGGGGGGAFGPRPIASPGNDGNTGPFGKDGGTTGVAACCTGGAGGYGGIGGDAFIAADGEFSTGASGGGGGGGVSIGGAGGGNGGGGTNGGNGVTATPGFGGGAGFMGSGAGGYGGGGGGGDNGGGGGGGGYGGGGGGSGYPVTLGGGGYGGGGGGSYVDEAATNPVFTAGVSTSGGSVVINYILPDLTPPTTAANVTGTAGANGWYTSAVSVSLTAADNAQGSGVAATYYTVDGGAQQTYGGAFSVSGDGAHPVTYWSVDNAGNTETAKARTLSIDTVLPTVSCSGAGSGWSAVDVSIACTASDATSGLANAADATFSLVTAVSAGTETAAASTNSRTVHDKAGLSATVGPITGIKIDKKPPSVACSAPPNGWQQSNVSVPCNASDGGSGLASPGDASFNLSTSVAAGSANGNASTNTEHVCDAVNNCANAGPIGGIQIDRQPPVTTAAPNGTAGTPPWFLTPVTVALTASDGAGSGVAHNYYTIDGGPPQSYAGTFTVGANGVHTVGYWSVDNVGNTEGAKTLSLSIDAVAPSCSASASPATIWPPNGRMVPVTVTVHATAGASGVESVSAGPVTSNEALGAGDVSGFALTPVGTTLVSVSGALRATRNGNGSGRTYSQTYTVTSGAGASATCTATVLVPHDSGH